MIQNLHVQSKFFENAIDSLVTKPKAREELGFPLIKSADIARHSRKNQVPNLSKPAFLKLMN